MLVKKYTISNLVCKDSNRILGNIEIFYYTNVHKTF
jgi:hypothetical protein